MAAGQRSQAAAAAFHSRQDDEVRDEAVTGINPLSLPTNRDRAEVFARTRGTAPYYDQRLAAWIVLDPPSVTRILQDVRLVMPDVNAAIGALEERYDIRLPQVRWAASILPLLTNGEHHRQIRQPLAKYLSSQMKGQRSWRETVAGLIADALSEPRRFDAFGELLLPVVNAIFADITRVAVTFEPVTLTKIFDRYASYRQLVDLEGKIAALRKMLAEQGAPPEAEGMLASFLILGRDSLLASFSESFLDLVTNRRGRRLNELQGMPPRLFSGVGIAERIAVTPVDFSDVRFEKGDRVRMYFQGFHALESESERLAFFGSGAHACLGKSLATDAWSLIAAEIARSPRTVAAVESEYDRGVVFSMPKYITIELV